jgi:uncharacterized protein (DUF1697 family)
VSGTRFVALLRGINVGGKQKVPMADLRALVEGLGHEDVATYVQSGNVVLRSGRSADAVARGIEQAIRRSLALAVSVIVRTRAQLAEVLGSNPYLGAGRDTSKLYVVYLDAKPSAAAVKRLDPDRGRPDEFTVRGREVYLQLPNGAGRSKLTLDWFEKQLGVRGTARNWRTTNELLALMDRQGDR